MEYIVKSYNNVTIGEMERYFSKGQIKDIDVEKGLVILYDDTILEKVSEITLTDYGHEDYDLALEELLDCYNNLKEEVNYGK